MLFRPFNLIRWLPVVGLSCLFSVAASAKASAFPHQSYCDVIHLDIALETDGALLVTETQTCLLDARGTRKLESIDPDNELLGYKLLKVCDVSKLGLHPRYRQRRELYRSLPQNQLGSREVINIPKIVEHDHTPQPIKNHTTGALSAQAHSSSLKAPTLVLKYRIFGGVETHNRYSQIYWQNLWSDSCFPINIGKITLQLPASLAKQVRYFEANARNVDATSRQIAPDTFEFTLEGPLRPNDGWNIRVVFPSDQLNQSIADGKKGSPADDTVLETTHWQQDEQLTIMILIFRLGLLLVFAVLLYSFVIIITDLIKYRCPCCRTLNSMYPINEPQSPENYQPSNHLISARKTHRCRKCSYVQRPRD